ncbi:MAG: hypothetical protein PHE56_15935 [Bacteroidales bacterium]|nr:hypothetical protein [Bacteroidales bacterium]
MQCRIAHTAEQLKKDDGHYFGVYLLILVAFLFSQEGKKKDMICYRAIFIKDGAFAGYKNFVLANEFVFNNETKNEILLKCSEITDNRYDEIITLITTFEPMKKAFIECVGVFKCEFGQLDFVKPNQEWIDKCNDYFYKFEPVKPARKKRTTKVE